MSQTIYAYCSSLNETQSNYDRAAIDHPRAKRMRFHDHSWFFHQSLKKLAVLERLFWYLGTRSSCRCQMYGLSAGTKKVTVVVVPCEQRLHFRGISWRAKSSLCRQPFKSVQKSGRINLENGFFPVLDRFRTLPESFVADQSCRNFFIPTKLAPFDDRPDD